MTVGELILRLQSLPQDLDVVVWGFDEQTGNEGEVVVDSANVVETLSDDEHVERRVDISGSKEWGRSQP